MSISIIIGTRAELIKTFPVIWELNKQKIPYRILATGQHNLNYLLEQFKINEDAFKYICPPREGFLLKTKDAIKFGLRNIPLIKKLLSKEEVVLIHGDTLSTVIGAIGARLRGCKVVHLEAGLRSWDIFEPFPEEISRITADFISEILFAVSELAYKNIKKTMPWKREVYLTGNTIVDSALQAYKLGKNISVPKEEYAIVSIHRHENLKSKIRMIKIIKIILETANRIKTYIFVYKNTEKSLKSYGLYRYLKKHKNIVLLKPLDYISFIRWLANAKIILTDGGSIQEESLIFRVPAVLLRMKTERIEGLYTGLNYLSRLNIEQTTKKIEKFLAGNYPKDIRNPYGKPGVSKRIVKILKDCV